LPGLDDAAASASADGNGVGDVGVVDVAAAGVAVLVGDCGDGAAASFVSLTVAAVGDRSFGSGARGFTAAERGPGATRAERGNSGSSSKGSTSGGSPRAIAAGGRGGS